LRKEKEKKKEKKRTSSYVNGVTDICEACVKPTKYVPVDTSVHTYTQRERERERETKPYDGEINDHSR
jgi:hypothetical protein